MSEIKKKIIRVAIADDHAMVRDGLRRSLEYSGLEIMGEAADGLEAVALVRKLNPDILLLDLNMPRHDGFEALRDLQTSGQSQKTRVIVLTAEASTDEVAKVLTLGARGLVLKALATDKLLLAIQAVMSGSGWVGSEPVKDLPSYLRAHLPASPSPRPDNYGLTKRELQIVSGVVSGRSNKEVADRFGIAEDTVKHHLSNVFDKTGVSTRVELVVFSIRHNIPIEELD
jgi:two-component system, NarL family, nitrate/nitrite response regulator NarL